MKKIYAATVFILSTTMLSAVDKPLMFSGSNNAATPGKMNFSNSSSMTQNSNTMSMGTSTRKSVNKVVRLNVKGQGVAPANTQSPAQAYALAKRAAITDAYRLLAEKIKGVKIEGQDLIKNGMVARSQVRTEVDALISKANIIETSFTDGLCEVEMELVIDINEWESMLARSSAY